MENNLARSELARGRDEDNKKYYSEDEHFFEEFGIPCNPKRTDLESVVELLQRVGGTLKHLINEMPVFLLSMGVVCVTLF